MSTLTAFESDCAAQESAATKPNPNLCIDQKGASAARLRARYALKLPDALILASAIEVGAQALVTHDRDFARVRGLAIV